MYCYYCYDMVVKKGVILFYYCSLLSVVRLVHDTHEKRFDDFRTVRVVHILGHHFLGQIAQKPGPLDALGGAPPGGRGGERGGPGAKQGGFGRITVFVGGGGFVLVFVSALKTSRQINKNRQVFGSKDYDYFIYTTIILFRQIFWTNF